MIITPFFKIFNRFFFSLFFLSVSLAVYGQQKESEDIAQALLPKIEKTLIKNNQAPPYQFILQLVDSVCEKQPNQKLIVFEIIMYKLEAEFNLLAAAYVGEALVAEAKRIDNKEAEANARFNLHRYYNALGNGKKATEHIELALDLFTQLNNPHKVLYCKVFILLDRRNFRSDEEILSELNKLLLQCQENNDISGQNILQLRMASINLSNGFLEEAEKNIEALEQFIKLYSDETTLSTSPVQTSLYRANLELAKEDTTEAIIQFKKTVEISQKEPDRWVEIYAMQTLASIYLNKGDYKTTKKYLALAHKKSIEINALDLISSNYLLESQLAEKEKRFEDAYTFVNKHYFYSNLRNERNNGFNLQNHYLTLEKEQLASDKKQQELELKIQKNQLKYYYLIFGLTLTILVILFFLFRKHKKGHKKLAFQNEIIKTQSLELKQIDQAKSRFFANISHELRTPLTLLTSPIKMMLAEKELTGKQHNLLEMANKSGLQLEALINEILDLRKLESGYMKMNIEPTVLSSFFLSYISQFESLANQKNIKYNYRNEVEEEVIAKLDREKWRQVMLNLISNAFKYTSSGGNILVTTKIENDNLKFIVADTGEGIDADELPKIFDLYYQGEKAHSNKAGGTGIGLTLCYEYAQLFNGSLDVESSIGQGSTFMFITPLLLADSKDALLQNTTELNITPVYQTELGQKNRPIHSSKSTILVVEDNLALQDFIFLILGEMYNVLLAENGQEALEIISSNKIQLIVSDLMMPVLDGYGLLNALKKNEKTSSIPLIMLTARTEIETKLKALRFGIDDYLTKPFDERELKARIENLLNTQKHRLSETKLLKKAEAPISFKENNDWVERFEKYIRTHLDDTTLNIPTIASEFAMSESTLLRTVKSLIGLTPTQYLKEMRLDEARKLLESRTVSSIKEVAAKSGFKDSSTFSRNYSSRFGKLPSEY